MTKILKPQSLTTNLNMGVHAEQSCTLHSIYEPEERIPFLHPMAMQVFFVLLISTAISIGSAMNASIQMESVYISKVECPDLH
jgi:hypothetical protein